MIHDLHSHTYYSGCGKDAPEVIIEAAINGGIEAFGICDHNYGIGDRKSQYFEQITGLKDVYKDRIKILCGIELATISNLALKEHEDISHFDYCLVEHIDSKESIVEDIISYSKKLKCKTGIAHTDLFRYIVTIGENPLEYLKRLAASGIFWEMNVSYDSIHSYREHGYYIEFLSNEYQQDIVRKSGIELSVGFDGHRVEDYRPDRVINMYNFIKDRDIKTVI